MKQEIIAEGKTVEAAIAAGAEQLGVSVASVTYELIEAPKKGFLGFGETPAKVKVSVVATPEITAMSFIKTVLEDIGINAETNISGMPGGKREYMISIKGEDASILIGHHGETLDALQYLTNLAANRRDDEKSGSYTRIAVDIENYREKREATLRKLAKRTADKVKKYKRSITLEPMSSYERRIIHSEIQGIVGVSTNSIGADSNRRVVVFLENQHQQSDKVTKKDLEKEDIGDFSYSHPITKNKIVKRARFDETLPEYHMGDAYSEGSEFADEEN